jgi:ubiquinone/menaquinone biosynthesis C-methylase UbiE
MGIFRKAAGEPLAVSMAGVKLGDRFLSIGIRDPKLIAALASKAGLSGRACAVDADEARATRGAALIEAEGALVEATRAPCDALPFDAASFDVAVCRDVLGTLMPDQRDRCAVEIRRVLRGGGRLIVIESAKVTPDALTTPLQHAGFAAVRVLAEAERLVFVEGVKKVGS